MRNRSALIIVVVGLITAIPIGVYASHQFNDVPNDHTFHSAIDWLADTGITAGCNPPANDEFCPDDPVNRGQMATFLKRFHDRFITGGGGAVGVGLTHRLIGDPPNTGNGIVDGLTLNLRVPASGVLVVEGSVDMRNPTEPDAFFCGVNAGGSPSMAQTDSWRLVDLTSAVGDTCSTKTVGLITPGNYVARIVLSGALGSTEAHAGVISATLYTDTGVFGLLGNYDEQSESGTISDTPKGG